MSDDVQAYLSSLPRWTKFLDSFRLPPHVNERGSIQEISQRLLNIRRRLRDGPAAPLRVAFFGPTGAGKSKLFGSLIRDDFSGSGFKRPFTRESFYFVHQDWQSLTAALGGEVSLHQDQDWRDLILIDTPDFDSVERENRLEAERVFLESDAFLFVTDALKYADASTWEYLKRIYSSEKRFAVILNKVNSKNVASSFRERFERTLTGGEAASYPEVIVPEFRIDDATLIDEHHACLEDLRRVARQLTQENGQNHASVELLVKECDFFAQAADELKQRIGARRQQIEEARRGLAARAETAKRRLGSRLSAGLEPRVREEVYEDVLRRLEKIDLLRYPRQLITMPIQGLRSLVSQWWPAMPSNRDVPPEAFADPISSETFHLLESEVIAFADQSRNDITKRPGLEQLIDRDSFKQLRLTHEELEELYSQHHQKFANWVAQHANETASEITTENKAKFVLSQVLFNTVLISSQVALGPGFTLLDLGTSGVVSPMVAKGISMAIGSEKVKEFEEAARQYHQQSLAEMIDLAASKFLDHLATCSLGMDDLEEQLSEMSASRSQTNELVRHFQGLGRQPASDPSTPLTLDPKE